MRIPSNHCPRTLGRYRIHLFNTRFELRRPGPPPTTSTVGDLHQRPHVVALAAVTRHQLLSRTTCSTSESEPSECRRGVLPCGFRVRSSVAESADCARAGLYLTAVRPTAFLAAQSYVVALVCSRILVPTLDIIFLPTLRTAKDRVDSMVVVPRDVQI